MGASSSKKKKNKKGDLADAAEGATSSLTKAIEDTSAAVTSKIENTAKSVTDAIDSTAKNLTGEAENAISDANKSAENAATGLSSTIDKVKGNVEQTVDDVTKSVESTVDSAKGQVKATESQIQQTTAEITKGLKDTADSASKTAQDAVDKAVTEADKGVKSVTTTVQKTRDDAKKSVDSKVTQLKSQAEAGKNELRGQADAASAKVSSTVGDLSKQAASAKEDLENQVNKAKANAESKASELRNSAESRAQDLKGTAEAKASELRGAAAELKSAADAKAAEVKETADKKTTEFKTAAETRATELKGTALTKASELNKQAETLKSGAENKVSNLQKSVSEVQDKVNDTKSGLTTSAETAKSGVTNIAEGLTTAVSGAVGGVVHAATDVAHKTVEGVGQTLSKATGNISGSLTGAVSQVSTSVTTVAGSAVTGLMDKAGLVGSSLAQGATNLNKLAESTLGKAADAVGGFLPTTSVAVCSVDDLKDGEMKVFKLSDEGSVLLVKENGQFSALGTKCSHYGAPLVKGVLYNGTVRCPWHGACFNAKTGDIEDSPGLDSLPCYQVSVEEGQVKVCAPSDQLKQNMRTNKLTRRDEQDQRNFVIVGGGGAAESCAETLRQNGFAGRLIVLTKEEHIPYDRPKLSKALSSTGKELALRSDDYFRNGDIEILLNHEVTEVDGTKKVVKCSNNSSFSFDKLLIATGGRPISMDVPGSDLSNIFYLRTPTDANKIAETAREKNAVVIGTSFIGMEVASYLNGKAKSVTVVGRSKTPFVNVFGEQLGERLKKLCVEKGIKFHTETGVTEFIGSDGKLSAVKLKNGEEVPADICIVGIGVRPSTEFLKGGSIPLNERGFIPVDKNMMTSVGNVFGAGDIVEFPLPMFNEEKANIGHWQMAQTQGRQAAYSMLELNKTVDTVPFFWCSLFGKSIRYAGYGVSVDDYIIDGDLQEMKFVLYACSGDNVVAVATMGCDPVASQFASYTCSGKKLSKSKIQSDPKAWIGLSC